MKAWWIERSDGACLQIKTGEFVLDGQPFTSWKTKKSATAFLEKTIFTGVVNGGFVWF